MISLYKKITLLPLIVGLATATAHRPTHAMALEHKAAFGAITAAAGVASYYAINNAYKSSIAWDWQTIDPTHLNRQPIEQIFAQHQQALAARDIQWLWGAGTSSHQVEGGCTQNNWHEWAQKPENRANGIVEAGIACDHWNRYKEDIQLAKQAGLTAYRFSIEWSKVMPTADTFDQAALDHYKDVCKELVANGIKPVITLYHYSEPLWFAHAESFAKEENIDHFVRFSQKVFEELHPYVHLWLTFNTPEGHAMPGWVYGDKPPGKKGQYQTAVEVMKNMLEAHVRVYQTLKGLSGAQSKIGFLKNIFQLDAWDACNPLDHFGCYIGHDLVNSTMYRFLRTGEYKAWIPGKASCTHTNKWVKAGNRCVDFIGLNYYCHGYMKNLKTIRDDKNEIPTLNNKYTIYGEGLHRALKELWQELGKPLGIPLYVTENGIGTDSDELRTLFYQRYMYALAKAIADGIDVRGYITWSLLDNYEWGEYKKRYGLYHVDSETQQRTLKPGARYYLNLVANSR